MRLLGLTPNWKETDASTGAVEEFLYGGASGGG